MERHNFRIDSPETKRKLAFPKNFHTIKLGEITVCYEVLSFILDDWQGSEYPTELHNNIPFMQNQYTNFRKAFSENKTLKPTNEVKPTNFSF